MRNKLLSVLTAIALFMAPIGASGQTAADSSPQEATRRAKEEVTTGEVKRFLDPTILRIIGGDHNGSIFLNQLRTGGKHARTGQFQSRST